MHADTLTKYLISELHRLVNANAQTQAVTRAMCARATDPVLKDALGTHQSISESEDRLLEWLLTEVGERDTPLPSRPVEVMAKEGWGATTQADFKLRDLEIATVSSQLQSYHLASWLGIAAWLRVLDLQTEADVVDRLTTSLRRLERELETLRPTLAQLRANPESTSWYRPSVRRAHGNIFKHSL